MVTWVYVCNIEANAVPAVADAFSSTFEGGNGEEVASFEMPATLDPGYMLAAFREWGGKPFRATGNTRNWVDNDDEYKPNGGDSTSGAWMAYIDLDQYTNVADNAAGPKGEATTEGSEEATNGATATEGPQGSEGTTEGATATEGSEGATDEPKEESEDGSDETSDWPEGTAKETADRTDETSDWSDGTADVSNGATDEADETYEDPDEAGHGEPGEGSQEAADADNETEEESGDVDNETEEDDETVPLGTGAGTEETNESASDGGTKANGASGIAVVAHARGGGDGKRKRPEASFHAKGRVYKNKARESTSSSSETDGSSADGASADGPGPDERRDTSAHGLRVVVAALSLTPPRNPVTPGCILAVVAPRDRVAGEGHGTPEEWAHARDALEALEPLVHASFGSVTAARIAYGHACRMLERHKAKVSATNRAGESRVIHGAKSAGPEVFLEHPLSASEFRKRVNVCKLAGLLHNSDRIEDLVVQVPTLRGRHGNSHLSEKRIVDIIEDTLGSMEPGQREAFTEAMKSGLAFQDALARSGYDAGRFWGNAGATNEAK